MTDNADHDVALEVQDERERALEDDLMARVQWSLNLVNMSHVIDALHIVYVQYEGRKVAVVGVEPPTEVLREEFGGSFVPMFLLIDKEMNLALSKGAEMDLNVTPLDEALIPEEKSDEPASK